MSVPRRAIVFFFDEGEEFTEEALHGRPHLVVNRPAVHRADDPRHLAGIIALPNDALEDDKRAAAQRRQDEADLKASLGLKSESGPRR